MTIAPNTRRAPQFSLGDRLKLARKVGNETRDSMAERLDVTPQTISNYESGKSTPSRLQINAWAVATEVDVEWLKTGVAQPDEDPRGGSESDGSPLSDSNRRPPLYIVGDLGGAGWPAEAAKLKPAA
jgi:transcriptional regulator with XRE-family HTH domain